MVYHYRSRWVYQVFVSVSGSDVHGPVVKLVDGSSVFAASGWFEVLVVGGALIAVGRFVSAALFNIRIFAIFV